MTDPGTLLVAGAAAVGCSALLGHWSSFQNLIISLTALCIGALVICNLPAMIFHIRMWFYLLKNKCHLFAKWAFFTRRWFGLRFLECRIFLGEFGILCRRCYISSYLLTNRQEFALYLRIWGFPDKPNYMFKVFDCIHSVMWPNDSSSPTATTNAAEAGQNQKEANEKRS